VRPRYHIMSDEGVHGTMLRAFDQGLPDTTDTRTERWAVMRWVPPGGRGCGEECWCMGGYKTLCVIA
jgi:hypothetical protein